MKDGGFKKVEDLATPIRFTSFHHDQVSATVGPRISILR